MSYAVKEIFYTLQGEGANTGRAAVFCRFAGCNLWTGRERDRHDATCQFCDTDFVGADEIGVAELTGGVVPVPLPPGPQVTAGKPAEHRGSAGVGAFALEGVEDL